MRWVAGLGVVAVVAAGCAEPTWYRPDTTAEALARDKSECEQSVGILPSPPAGSYTVPDYEPWVANRWAGSEKFSYGPTHSELEWFEREHAYEHCMTAKGYRLSQRKSKVH